MSIWMIGKPMLAATMAVAAAGSVQASVTYYQGFESNPAGSLGVQPVEARADFGARLQSSATETLEAKDLVSASTLLLQGIGVLTGSSGVVKDNDCDENTCNGRFNTTGATATEANPGRWWETADDFTIVFNPDVSAFGFYATDVGDFGVTLDLIFTLDAGGEEKESVSVNGTSGSVNFFGAVVDDGRKFKSVRFDITQRGSVDRIGFDDFVVGQLEPSIPVPLPGTAALAALGLGLLGATRRRRG